MKRQARERLVAALFTPVHPPRPPHYRGVWRSLVGENARNGVAGWSEQAFEDWYVRRNVLGTIVHIPRRPDMIERVLRGNAGNYGRPQMVKRIFRGSIGDGLFNADGELWRTQRKLVAASFAPAAVARLSGLMADAAARTTTGWPERGRIDIARAATETTMQIIADVLFSGDPRIMTEAAIRHIEAALIGVGRMRIMALLGFPELRIGRIARAGLRGRRFLRRTLETLVHERGPGGGPQQDFMSGLIRDLHEIFPPEQAERLAVDNAATFYIAGHETTATALSWTVYLLANAPEAQEQARAEAVAALQADDLQSLPDRLPYLRQILEEAMRLYPPAARIEREAIDDDDLCGMPIRKGDHVSIWPWVVHRHKRLWENSDSFDPDRFAPGTEAGRHRFQYIPFGGGPRVCVGARFATTEALIILAYWLAARRFRMVEGFVPDPVATVTLRPQGGMWVEVEAI
jgi:cytochrome P450